ncbi:hypothetical protein ABZP36_016044 [Zizania latifolia]
MSPAPAVETEGREGDGAGAKSQNTVKSEDDRRALTLCTLDSSDTQGPALDVQGGGGAGESVGNMAVKSEPLSTCTDAPEGNGALLLPSTKPAGADPMAGASFSHDIDMANSDPLNDEEEGDTTECSSSFGISCCETDDDDADHCDSEVNSLFAENADGDQASMCPRKKRVTAEWRSAVRPMLWRFQWLELRMKDLLSQVSKYDRELAIIKKEKELQQTNDSRSEPVQLCKGHENSCMERRKRRRHEEIIDTSLYIKKHQILSYFYDKQNKGAETDGFLIDDDSSGPVGSDVKGGLNNVGLLEPKEYDMVAEQLTLQKILLTIGGIQSQVYRLQDRLSKARTKQENMASLVDHAHIKVSEKRLRTQKRSFSYKKDRYTKAQKKKNLNILLKEDRPAHEVISLLSERAPDCQTEVAKFNSEEKSGEKCPSHKAITVDLLLGADSSLPNGHMGDLCKENSDDILIDNQAAKEEYQPFENAKHLMEQPPELTEKVAKTATLRVGNNSSPVEVANTSAPLIEVENACAPLEVGNSSGPVVKQEPVFGKAPALKYVYSGKRKGRKAKKGWVSGSKSQSKESSKTPTANQKTESTYLAAKKPKIEKTTPPVKKEETEKTLSTDKKPKAGMSCSSIKESEKSSSATRKDICESSPKPRIEKAVLVAVNSRRSQRVRKLKIY